ncbi:neural-cadherin-like [Limulus polyphemus]|uniref:Neural-cadherin-like n=1 Tax=Limulus polyphemus TaxID=6850 RepID=A0ABM1SW51_LIMPO|nr:neural-cadherin-like [Limulus polyphemus]
MVKWNAHPVLQHFSAGGRFEVDERSGEVRTRGKEPFMLDKEYVLYVKAEDRNGKVNKHEYQSTSEMRLSIMGGKRAPQFYMEKYETNIPENQRKDSDVIEVKAKSFADRQIRYTLRAKGSGAGTFNIEPSVGIVKLAKDLDYEDLRQPKKYSLVVTATEDSGGFSTSVDLTITVNDVNDNSPRFELPDYQAHNIDEDIPPGTSILQVVASDKDGDNIHFGFVGGGTVSGMFQIEERTGVIRLINGHIQLDKDKYELNVTAQDDGSCCKDGSLTPHTSTALVVVFITDVNDNKPEFEECDSYLPTVEEGAPSGTVIITVKASDQDKGHNGLVRYSIVQQPNQKGTKFLVDEVSGDVKTNKVFDREGEDGRFVSVTVKATDRGNPPLEGACSFKVEITDINDNPPLFDRQEYKEHVKQDTPVGTNILRVSASDEDADDNGAVMYNLSAPYDPSDVTYFKVNPDSGWVILQKPLDRQQFHLRAVALDKGKPQHRTTVELTIEVVDRDSNPPVWDQPIYGPIMIKENLGRGEVVTSIKARSGIPSDPAVFYTLMKGSNEQTNSKDTFYLAPRPESNGDMWADIMVNYPLDYEKLQQYNLTIRVENNGVNVLAAECTVYIVLEDVNDEIPLFIETEQETVLEGMPPMTKVTTVTAVDKDGTYPNNKVYYKIEEGGDRYFSIDKETGTIFTRVEFDREEKQAYAIKVSAEDGALSDRPHEKFGIPKPNKGEPKKHSHYDVTNECLLRAGNISSLTGMVETVHG